MEYTPAIITKLNRNTHKENTMSKTAAHLRALELFQSKATVTPSELEKYVGAGPYASKYVCYLRLEGHVISAQKQGRSIVSYTYESAGDSATRNYKWVSPKQRAAGVTPKARKPKAAKVAAPKKAKAKKSVAVAKTSDEKLAMIRELAEKRKAKTTKVVQEQDAGEVASYGVDADWDSMEGVDVSKLVA